LGRLKGRRLRGITRRGWEDNIKAVVKEMDVENAHWI
jgi:hypothetical protein